MEINLSGKKKKQTNKHEAWLSTPQNLTSYECNV